MSMRNFLTVQKEAGRCLAEAGYGHAKAGLLLAS